MRIVIAIIVGMFALGLASQPTAAQEPFIIIIVHAKNPITALDKKAVTDVFLKKRSRWNEDLPIQPVDQARTGNVRKRFSTAMLDRSVASVRTYWNQLVFSGRGVPPPEFESDDDVIRYVTGHVGAIGYVSSLPNAKGVKVIQVR